MGCNVQFYVDYRQDLNRECKIGTLESQFCEIDLDKPKFYGTIVYHKSIIGLLTILSTHQNSAVLSVKECVCVCVLSFLSSQN